MSSKVTIALKDLEIGYRSKKSTHSIIQNINNDLSSGELICLLGANGIGKSTLLRTLTGSLSKLDGEVKILGLPIESYTDKELAKVISIVLTQKPDVENMTAYELIALGRTPYTDFWGKLSTQDKQIVEEAITDIGIANLRDRYINTLSDGERQKVMIAKALVQDTPIILLDEPTAFLDYPSKADTMHLLQRLAHQKNKTILLSTHDMELAIQIADKIWLFSPDKKLHTGVPEDLAIQGIFEEFLANTDIYFDRTSGLLSVHHPTDKTISIHGESKLKQIIKKALYRVGIRAQRDLNSNLTQLNIISDSPLQIEVRYNNGQMERVSSIAQLLQLKEKF